MKRLFLAAFFTLTSLAAVFGQNSDLVKQDLNQAEIDGIIKKFTRNEGTFRQALNVYAFNRYATFSTVGMGGQITGTYARDSFLTFSDSGQRFERILRAPVSTIKDIVITVADIENLGGLDPFAIEPKMADQYNFTYLGKERIDELNLHVFDVAPKVMPDWKKGVAKFFQGRIWVDDEDFMIVKSKGKAVPEGKERFATIETFRENVDGKYWFPSFSTSDDELVFDSGQAVKIRIRVRYKDYRVGRTDVKILDDDVVVEPTPTPSPTTPAKKP